MGDTAEGSSSAAHSAQDTHIAPKKGALRRLTGLFSSGETASSDQPQGPAPNPTPAVPEAMPRGMANLRRMRVEDVAIPRIEVVAVPSEIELDELIETFRESGNTRLPVYDGTIDNPLGLVHLKDVALRYGFNGHREKPFELTAMLRPLIYAPPSMPIGVLLQKMQADRRHMALVIDEYGGVDGLVTIEDLIEQVIGEIEDEHDIEEEEFWIRERPGSYLVLAKAPLEEFEAEIGMKLADAEDEEEVDTLGGLVFMEIGRVPARGEVIPHSTGAQIEVVDADPRRIKRLRVRLPGAAPLRPAAE